MSEIRERSNQQGDGSGVTQDRAGPAVRRPIDDSSVDSVVSALVLCSIKSQQDAHREIARIVRPSGRFCFLRQSSRSAFSGEALHALDGKAAVAFVRRRLTYR